MKFSDLLTNERDFVIRSLAFCGMRIITNLSTVQGRLKLSGHELEDEEIQEIHLLDGPYEAITEKLSDLGFIFKFKTEKWLVYVHPEEILHEQPFDGILKIGYLVLVNFGEDKGLKAFVYGNMFGFVSLISETGNFYNGYTETPFKDEFTFLRDTFFRYQFSDDLQVSTDFRKGLFKDIFI